VELRISKLKKREGRIGAAGGYLLVKSRPRQKLPRQSSTAQRLDTPPSPPFLQFMAAADAQRHRHQLFSVPHLLPQQQQRMEE
jgi:hypothetical protein